MYSESSRQLDTRIWMAAGHRSVFFLPSCRRFLTGSTMTRNIRRWNLELARLSVINAEEMKSVLDGSKARLC